MENWEKYFERRKDVSDQQSMHDDIKEELLDFMTWVIKEEGMTTDEQPTNPESFVNDYIDMKRKNSRWAW